MFEEKLEKAMFSSTGDKTFIDKLLGKEDIGSIKRIMKKSDLTKEDLAELLYLLSSGESKLFNFSSYERYVYMKFFVWIREFVKITESFYDYYEDIKNKKLTDASRKMLKNTKDILVHNVKFVVDLYFNIGRTSLSLGATGFLEILKNKYEINYGGSGSLTPLNTTSTPKTVKGA